MVWCDCELHLVQNQIVAKSKHLPVPSHGIINNENKVKHGREVFISCASILGLREDSASVRERILDASGQICCELVERKGMLINHAPVDPANLLGPSSHILHTASFAHGKIEELHAPRIDGRHQDTGGERYILLLCSPDAQI
jgi:hypothetical protein